MPETFNKLRRKVYHITQLIPLFINRSVEYARNKKDNIYISNNCLYSYGSHFIIAKWILTKNNEYKLLCTLRRNSKTTNRQINMFEKYSCHLDKDTKIYTFDPDIYDIDSDITEIYNKIIELRGKYYKAKKTKETYQKEIIHWCNIGIKSYEFYTNEYNDKRFEIQKETIQKYAIMCNIKLAFETHPGFALI